MEGKTVYTRGMEIQVSFISDHGKTAKGFDLTWRVTLPATTTLPKTTLITAQKVDLTSTIPIKTTTTPRRNVLTTKLLYTSSTKPIRSTAPRENLKSTTLLHTSTSTKHFRTTAQKENIKSTTVLHKSTPKKPSSTTTRIDNLKTTTLLHTSKATNPIRTTAQKENLKSTRLLHTSTPTKPSSTTTRIENLKTTTLLHTSKSTNPIRTTSQKENLKSTTPVYESKQFGTSIHDAFRTTFFPSTTDLYGVSTLPHKAQSVTTMTETTATNEPEDTLLGMTSMEIVYLIGGVGAFVLVVSISVICVAGRGRKDNKKIQKRHQKDTDKRETLASMHLYSSPMYETIPADMISSDEATGDYALVNDKEFTWYAAKNVSDSEHMTRVDSFSNVTDVYHTLEPNTRFTEPSPLLQRISNVYHTLEMTSFLQPE
nr:hepatitis A virus cellular receptor 1-like isoform X2 [Crassostrea virginica]